VVSNYFNGRGRKTIPLTEKKSNHIEKQYQKKKKKNGARRMGDKKEKKNNPTDRGVAERDAENVTP